MGKKEVKKDVKITKNVKRKALENKEMKEQKKKQKIDENKSTESSSSSSNDDNEQQNDVDVINKKNSNDNNSSSSSDNSSSSDDDKLNEKSKEVGESNKKEENERQKKKIFIKNLNYETTEETLKSFFEDCGVVEEVIILKRGEKSRGMAFVTFATEEEALKGLEKDGEELDERSIKIELSKPQTKSQI